MAFNTAAPLQALQSIVQGLVGMQGAVSLGQPESGETRVTAWVVVGGHEIRAEATQTRIRSQRYIVFLAYRVGGSEGAAELLIATLSDQFGQAIVDDPTLGDTVLDAEIISAGADIPEYLNMAAQELRLYPIVVQTKQRTTFYRP